MTHPITQKTMSRRAWAELALLSLIWGGSFLSIRIALDTIGPLTVVAHRVGWATLILWTYVVIRRFAVPRDLRFVGACLGMGLLNNVIPFSLMAWGQLHIETGLTSILNASTAVFGVLAAAVFFSDETLTRNRLIGVCLGFAGAATAIGPAALLDVDLRSLGQLAILGGTLSYALGGVWARKWLSGVRPEVAAAGMLAGASVVMLPVAMLVEGPIRFDLPVATWGAIGYYAVAATAFAYLLYYRVLAMAGSGNLMLVTLLIAPVAILLGAAVLGEQLPPRAFAGFALLGTGLWVLNTSGRRASAAT